MITLTGLLGYVGYVEVVGSAGTIALVGGKMVRDYLQYKFHRHVVDLVYQQGTKIDPEAVIKAGDVRWAPSSLGRESDTVSGREHDVG